MKEMTGWKSLGVALHRLSWLKIAFYALGFYYQLATYLGSRAQFTRNLCTSLFMFGLGMMFEALRDNQLAARRHDGKSGAQLSAYQVTIAVAVIMFCGVVALGLFFLYFARDRFQGEAILAFGIGGLALFRLEYDCLSHALSLRAEPAAERPAAATADHQEVRLASRPPVDETGRGGSPV